jgi:hypothetical protein
VVEAAEQFEVLPPAEFLVERRVLAEQADPQAHLVRLAHHVVSRHDDPAGVGAEQGGQDPDQSGLARAVRPEHRVDRGAGDREVESVECGRARSPGSPVRLACFLDGDRRVGH